MHKVRAIVLAVTILLPAVVIAAGPAAAATTGLTCAKLTGTTTWTPPVPAAPKLATSSVVLKASLSGCTGTPKITGGAITLPAVKGIAKQNCTTLLTKPTKITVPKGGTITWNNKAKSTLGAMTLTPAGTATYKATVKVAAGQFLNKTVTLTGAFKPNGCPLKLATLTLKAGTKAIIK